MVIIKSLMEQECMEYFLKQMVYIIITGSPKNYQNLEKYIIDKNKYAIFKLISKNQEDIVDLEEKINKQWIPSTNYNIKNNFKIELYKDNCCYIYLPIK